MRRETELAVVIPVHDEPMTIHAVVVAVSEVLRQAALSSEIIVIDDGSPIPIELQPNDDYPIQVLKNTSRQGSGASRKRGHTLTSSEWILWIDADATYEPTDLRRLWEARIGYDQVIGARACDHGRWRGLRYRGKMAACRIASSIWNRPIPDLNSGLRLMRRDAASIWITDLPDGFSCTTTATLAALHHGQKVRFVPIQYYERKRGSRSKFRPIRDTIRFYRALFRWRP